MIALDTNVLVRFLVNDDKKQADVARKIIKEAELSKQPLICYLFGCTGINLGFRCCL